MKKLNVLLSTLLSVFLFTSVQAGSLGMGVSGNIASVSADGTETINGTEMGTENSVKNATAGNNFMFGSVYAEYAFGDAEKFVFGIEHVPFSGDINSKTLSRTDATDAESGYTAQQSGTVKANASIDNHTTYYVEVGAGGTGLYGKVGFAQVNIDVKQTNAANYGTYPDKTLDAWTYALGYKTGFGEKGVVKVEGFMTDYDNFSATSTSSNTVSANLDVVGAKLSLGVKF
tara:strand:- start:30 stop:719 length:690 start_codon:yes stop_codon:yes gene_type:complete